MDQDSILLLEMDLNNHSCVQTKNHDGIKKEAKKFLSKIFSHLTKHMLHEITILHLQKPLYIMLKSFISRFRFKHLRL